ncbi:MAG: DUF5702 domain-containing protein [Eubacteriales bacterium]|nr:DUF5702 domain-containing protein [Eubacteriales bacterium]
MIQLKKYIKNEKPFYAVVSIYLSISFVCILSLILVLIESCRIRGAALYYQYASNNAIDSMFSLYHRDLWNMYRIFGIEYNEEDLLKKEYYDFLIPHLDVYGENVQNYFAGTINEDIDMKMKNLLSDYNFENEIKDYMNYGIIDSVISFASSKFEIKENSDLSSFSDNILENTKKQEINENIKQTVKEYEINSNEFLALDEEVKKLNNKINDTNEATLKLKETLYDREIETIISKLSNLRKSTDDCESLITSFFNKKNNLIKRVNDLEKKYNIERVSLSEEEGLIIKTQISDYKEYFSHEDVIKTENSIKNVKNELSIFPNKIQMIELFIDDYYDELSNAQDIEDKSERNDEIRRVYREYRELAEEISYEFEDIEVSLAYLNNNPINKGLLNILDNIKNVISDGLLSLAMPNEYVYNEEILLSKERDIKSDLNIIYKCLYTEYTFSNFNFYNREKFIKEEVRSLSKKFEVEYIISGKTTDKEALKSTLYRILAMREGANMIHIVSSPEKLKIVMTEAAKIGGSPALAAIWSFLFITIWALVQSVYDIKILCKGEKVPPLHTNKTWDIDGTLLFKDGLEQINKDKEETTGLSYKDYLRIILLLEKSETINERFLNLMEYNIKKKEEEFDIEKLCYSLSFTNHFKTYPLMTIFKMFDKLKNSNVTSYSLDIESYCSYEGIFNSIE